MSAPPQPRDPADTRRRISLTREQRDRINTAAVALEAHAGDDENPLAILLAAAELRAVAGQWDRADNARSTEPGQQRLRDALRQIARADSGIWGWIAHDALDEREVTNSDTTGARGEHTPEFPGEAIAAHGHGAQARR